MDKESIKIFEEDMKFNLEDFEENKILENFKEFEKKVIDIKNYELENEDIELFVTPVYDNITTYLREDEVSDEVESAKEAVSLSKDYKDGFFTIPKVVN